MAVTEDERVMWASSFERTLQGIEEQTKATIWKSWLEEYWRNRLNGIPVPLTEREGEQMAEWSAHLEPVFPEAVEYGLLTPVPDLKNSFLHTDLSESSLPSRYPTAVAKLVLYLLKNATSLPWDTRWIEPLVTQLASISEARVTVGLICEELARLGVANAGRLRSLLE